MRTRVMTAIVGISILLPVLLFAGAIGIAIIVVVSSLIGLSEYNRMVKGSRRELVLMTVVWAVVVLPLLVFGPDVGVTYFAATFFLATMLAFTFEVLDPRTLADGSAGRVVAQRMFGVSWVGLLVTMALLRQMDGGLGLVLMSLFICWAADSGAYFVGVAIGKHKMAPTVSPKKSWEGFFGGLAAAVAVVLLSRGVSIPLVETGEMLLPATLSTSTGVVVALVLGCFAVLGDLSESLIKRSYGVKDSGTILPGHGGVLDRLDSVMFVAPALYFAKTLQMF
jgi:phosphatidate cytidylyltransferase